MSDMSSISPSPYASFSSVWAENRCGSKFGTTMSTAIVAVNPTGISSVWSITTGLVNQPFMLTSSLLNFADLATCSNPAGGGGVSPVTRSDSSVENAFVWNSCTPIINIPSEAASLQPEWATCGGWYHGVFDPPMSLAPQAFLTPPSPTPASPTITSSSPRLHASQPTTMVITTTAIVVPIEVDRPFKTTRKDQKSSIVDEPSAPKTASSIPHNRPSNLPFSSLLPESPLADTDSFTDKIPESLSHNQSPGNQSQDSHSQPSVASFLVASIPPVLAGETAYPLQSVDGIVVSHHAPIPGGPAIALSGTTASTVPSNILIIGGSTSIALRPKPTAKLSSSLYVYDGATFAFVPPVPSATNRPLVVVGDKTLVAGGKAETV